jgi:hypothetical protein
VLLVSYDIGFGAAFSPLITQALVQVPPAKAADASGLLTTTIQLSQVLGVAVFGSLFLGLAGQPGAHASAAAFSTVERWLAALTLLGIVGALLLAAPCALRRAEAGRPARRLAQPFSAPPVRPSTSRRSVAKNSTMIGRVRITEPAIRVVLATSTDPASWDRPRDTVQFSRFSTKNSRANRNSFQARMVVVSCWRRWDQEPEHPTLGGSKLIWRMPRWGR